MLLLSRSTQIPVRHCGRDIWSTDENLFSVSLDTDLTHRTMQSSRAPSPPFPAILSELSQSLVLTFHN